MTLSEFKAWFEGYTENIDGAPNEKQFEKIKAKVAEINGVALTREVIVERYRDLWPRRWPEPIVSWSAGSAGMNGVGNAVLQNAPAEFDSHSAMRAIGMVEASAA